MSSLLVWNRIYYYYFFWQVKYFYLDGKMYHVVGDWLLRECNKSVLMYAFSVFSIALLVRWFSRILVTIHWKLGHLNIQQKNYINYTLLKIFYKIIDPNQINFFKRENLPLKILNDNCHLVFKMEWLKSLNHQKSEYQDMIMYSSNPSERHSYQIILSSEYFSALA